MTLSANEIETLILKAARGGGLPTGHGEDLAAASAYLDLDRLAQCPCREGGAAMTLPIALDLVRAGEGPQTVIADPAIINAYIAMIETQTGQSLVWTKTETGAVFERFEDTATNPHPPLGRRDIPRELLTHLNRMAAKMLVPETDASRAGGAGAGLTDND